MALTDDPTIEALDGVDRGDDAYVADLDIFQPDLEVGTRGEVVGFSGKGDDSRFEVKALLRVGRKTWAVTPALLRRIED